MFILHSFYVDSNSNLWSVCVCVNALGGKSVVKLKMLADFQISSFFFIAFSYPLLNTIFHSNSFCAA